VSVLGIDIVNITTYYFLKCCQLELQHVCVVLELVNHKYALDDHLVHQLLDMFDPQVVQHEAHHFTFPALIVLVSTDPGLTRGAFFFEYLVQLVFEELPAEVANELHVGQLRVWESVNLVGADLNYEGLHTVDPVHNHLLELDVQALGAHNIHVFLLRLV